MTTNGWFQILFFFAVILAVTKPHGVEVDKKDAQGKVINGLDGQPLKETQRVAE